jgi:2-methylisocitrate lyase-like PEP mutase family enzyme
MSQANKAKLFAKLHVTGSPVILYNAWDAGSTKAHVSAHDHDEVFDCAWTQDPVAAANRLASSALSVVNCCLAVEER